MASDDYAVVAFKLMSYLYACLKAGAYPNPSFWRRGICLVSKPSWMLASCGQ